MSIAGRRQLRRAAARPARRAPALIALAVALLK
jgi:hypothetical protein